MGFSRDNIKEAKDIFRIKSVSAREAAQRRTQEMYERIPDLRVIDEGFKNIGAQIVALATSKMSDALRKSKIDSLKAESDQLEYARRECLRSAGYPEDYTDVHYECGVCKDTGYDGIKMCACMKRVLIFKSYESSGLGALLGRQDFDGFDLSYYSGESRTNMEQILNMSKNYAISFGDKSENLLMIGATGLGKTHLSTSIAKMVIDKGYDVLYTTTHELFSVFENERFRGYGAEEARKSDRYFECDLLIIDDLGTELANSFSVSCLYNIINTRYNKGLPVIINTNLRREEIVSRYSDRIASRLFGEYIVLAFYGEDIRKQRLLK